MLFSISWFKVTVNERCEVGTTPALSGKPPNPLPSSGLWRRENWLSILFSETQFAKIHLHEETKSVENRLRRITNIYISNIPLKKKKKDERDLWQLKLTNDLKKIIQGKQKTEGSSNSLEWRGRYNGVCTGAAESRILNSRHTWAYTLR